MRRLWYECMHEVVSEGGGGVGCDTHACMHEFFWGGGGKKAMVCMHAPQTISKYAIRAWINEAGRLSLKHCVS